MSPAKTDTRNQRHLLTFYVVSTPDLEASNESMIRDTKDLPILRAAIAANADVLLTGDKDFFESGINIRGS